MTIKQKKHTKTGMFGLYKKSKMSRDTLKNNLSP